MIFGIPIDNCVILRCHSLYAFNRRSGFFINGLGGVALALQFGFDVVWRIECSMRGI